METFYLGTGKPHWVGEDSPLPEHVPMCISRESLTGRATFPRARGPWLLDSGSFSILSGHLEEGEYADISLSPHQYVRDVRRYDEEIGPMDGAASLDWMCEQPVVARTGLDIKEHQRRSVWSYLELKWLAPDLKIFPVIQGDASVDPSDHLRCIEMYDQAGIDLTKEPLVGVGSVCRLQRTSQIVDLFAALETVFAGTDVRLHGFGVKKTGLTACAPAMYSADSQAWSRRGRDAGPCRHGLGHISEANCHHFAMEWYNDVMRSAATTTLDQWRRTVQICAQGGQQEALPIALPPSPTPPNLPTLGQTYARISRAFLPETVREGALASAIDALVVGAFSEDD